MISDDVLEAFAQYARATDTRSSSRVIRFGVVDPAFAGAPALAKVTFDGESTLSTKGYQYVLAPAASARVMLIPCGSNNYVIGGTLGYAAPGGGATGATGSIGFTGATGAGVTGATGPIGPTGVQGFTGAAGAVGATGVGVQGFTGATGPAGATGVGTQGFTGATGPGGVQGSTGATGPQGVAGGSTNWCGAWATSMAYATNDAVSINGSSYICIAPHTSSATDQPGVGANWMTYWALIAQGGSSGSTGATGPAGATGVGTPGAAGATGATGPAGATGAIPNPLRFTGATGATPIEVYVTGDTQPRWQKYHSGMESFGNGSSPPGVNFGYSPVTGGLFTNGKFQAVQLGVGVDPGTNRLVQIAAGATASTGPILLTTSSTAAGNRMLATQGSAGSSDAFTLDYDGRMQWGPGSAGVDTNLYRVSADVLKSDDTLIGSGSKTAYSASATGATGPGQSTILTLSSMIFKANTAYLATFKCWAYSNSPPSFAHFRIYKTNTSGNAYGEYGRWYVPGNAIGQAICCYAELILVRDSSSDLTADVVLSVGVSTGTLTFSAGAGYERWLTIRPIGPASEYVGAGVSVT